MHGGNYRKIVAEVEIITRKTLLAACHCAKGAIFERRPRPSERLTDCFSTENAILTRETFYV